MKFIRFDVITITVIAFLLFLFRHWFFSTGTLSAGDWLYLYPDAIAERTTPYHHGHWGLGSTQVLFSGLEAYVQLGAQFLHAFASWEIVERVLWVIPFLLISFFSAWKLTRSSIGGLIFTTNTYILMILSGGQVGVSLAYAFVPLVLYFWMKGIDGRDPKALKNMLLVGLVLGIQMLFDPRIALLTGMIAVLYAVFVWSILSRSFTIIVPICLAFLLNSFWLLPLVIFSVGPSDHVSPMNYSLEALTFFSFSDFSHSLSLLHPNWPENLFGKVYFLQPEYLILPTLAFLPLAFFDKANLSVKEKIRFLFFSLVGIVGAFLAKGTSEPFGFVYIFLFENIPGFVVFREPTKFLLFTAVAYAVLIPLSLKALVRLALSFSKKRWQVPEGVVMTIVATGFIVVWGLLIRDALVNPRGSLESKAVPQAYQELHRFLTKDENFSRILWVPKHQRFGYFSDSHPALSAEEFFQTSSPAATIAALSDPQAKSKLQDAAVRYVVLPYDSEGEIFLEDRSFSKNVYDYYRNALRKIDGFTQATMFGDIIVYELPDGKEHIFRVNGEEIAWSRVSPTHFSVLIEDAKKGEEIVFSEEFSRFWQVNENGKESSLTPYDSNLTAYRLQETGRVVLNISHVFSGIVSIGGMVSVLSLILVFAGIAFYKNE